jgi:Trp operon repressor
MQKPLQTLLEKEMTRKEFMTTLGVGVASVMGFSSLLKLAGVGQQASHHNVSSGYGSSAYGGVKNS